MLLIHSYRIISIRLDSHSVNMIIIHIYAPTSNYDDEDIDIFNEDIEQTMAEVHAKTYLLYKVIITL